MTANDKLSLKDESRRNWTSKSYQLSQKQIHLGAILRIADATEKMCLDREQLERDYNYMRKSRDKYRELYETERRRNAGLKGYISRLKRRLEQ